MPSPRSDPPRAGAPLYCLDGGAGASSQSLFEEGERAFPGLGLPIATFASFVAARRVEGETFTPARGADLYIACACVAGARGAIEAFDRTYLNRVGAFLSRMKPSAALVDEVRQDVREKLFVGKAGKPAKIAEYTGRGALLSWVRMIALRAAIDLRKRSDVAVDSEEREAPADTLDPEIGYVKRRYRRAFNEAFRRALALLSAEQWELLRLHFADGLTLDELAVKLKVHRATIARRIAGSRRAVTEEARRLLRAELGASEAELESLVGVMRSQLDLSLPGLLRAG